MTTPPDGPTITKGERLPEDMRLLMEAFQQVCEDHEAQVLRIHAQAEEIAWLRTPDTLRALLAEVDKL